jgi:hypothetical protein
MKHQTTDLPVARRDNGTLKYLQENTLCLLSTCSKTLDWRIRHERLPIPTSRFLVQQTRATDESSKSRSYRFNSEQIANDQTPITMTLAEQHNSTLSSFYNLPVELLLNIADFLPLVPTLIMQRVCSKFRYHLYKSSQVPPEKKHSTLRRLETFQFNYMLRRDKELILQKEYTLACGTAPKKIRSARVSCSGCRKTHCSNSFSKVELRRPAITRLCKGLSGQVFLCEHYSFSTLCLLRGSREMRGSILTCSREHRSYPIVSYAAVGYRNRGWPIMEIDKSGATYINRSVLIADIASDVLATRESLSLALRELDVYICPHLKSSDPRLFDGKMFSAECSYTIVSPSGTITRNCPCQYLPPSRLRDEKATCLPWASCLESGCKTRYCFRRVSKHQYSTRNLQGIFFQVSSVLIGDPTHSSWQAQTIHSNDETHVTSSLDCGCRLECCLDKFDSFRTLDLAQ